MGHVSPSARQGKCFSRILCMWLSPSCVPPRSSHCPQPAAAAMATRRATAPATASVSTKSATGTLLIVTCVPAALVIWAPVPGPGSTMIPATQSATTKVTQAHHSCSASTERLAGLAACNWDGSLDIGTAACESGECTAVEMVSGSDCVGDSCSFGCDLFMVGNGACDANCSNAACGFDSGDCGQFCDQVNTMSPRQIWAQICLGNCSELRVVTLYPRCTTVLSRG